MDIEVMKVGGRTYLTLLGFNQLRKAVGLEALRPALGEGVLAFKERARSGRQDFIKNYPHLVVGFDCE